MHEQIYLHSQQIMANGWPYLRQQVTRVWQALSNSMINETSKNKILDHHVEVEIIRKEVYSSYQPKIYSGKVTLFKSTDRSGFGQRSNALGWNKMLPRLEVVSIKGDHLGILKPPIVDDIASNLSNKMCSAYET